MTFAGVERGGDYLRVVDPAWSDPLDPSHSRLRGGRWNARGSFAVLYLNADRATARANVDRRFAGLPYGVMDLRPERRPVLAGAVVPRTDFVDVVTDQGCVAAGLPATYPVDSGGDEVPHDVCQPIGHAAKADGWPGIACRSAARPAGEELAWFTEDTQDPTTREQFDDWYW